jgi:hypothetical protein
MYVIEGERGRKAEGREKQKFWGFGGGVLCLLSCFEAVSQSQHHVCGLVRYLALSEKRLTNLDPVRERALCFA